MRIVVAEAGSLEQALKIWKLEDRPLVTELKRRGTFSSPSETRKLKSLLACKRRSLAAKPRHRSPGARAWEARVAAPLAMTRAGLIADGLLIPARNAA